MTGRAVALPGIDLFAELRGEGEPLLLLHGFTGAGSNWDLIFPDPPAGFRTIAPDLRGHGRSTNPAGEFTFRQSALDMFALLDALEIERCKAIGVSAGAKTLLHMATQQPARLDAMVVVSATPHFPPEARAAMDAQTVESKTEKDWALMRKWHVQGDAQIRMLWEQGRALKDSYEDMNFTPERLEAITARTLIVHGDADPYYPIEMGHLLHHGIRGSRLWIVENGGHGPIFGPHAPGFAKRAFEFLSAARRLTSQ